ncbi:hypothetical protein ACQKNX_08020 [Lysinibacillus sp. NPDC093712]
MQTSTKVKSEIGRIVQNFINQGYKNIDVSFNNGQWTITAKH